jgi:hypothetical protein
MTTFPLRMTLIAASLMAPLAAQNLTVFSNGEVADANAVNGNFNTVNDKANAAQSAASAAQTAANGAQNTAAAAQGTAQAAQVAADMANAGVNAINNAINFGSGVIGLPALVGIGTNSPAGRLHVRRDGASGPLLRLDGTGLQMKLGTGQEWDVYAGTTDFAISRSGIDFPFAIRSDTGNIGIGTTQPGSNFKLEVAGNIRCVSLTQTSRRDFKADVAPLASGLDTVMKLRSVRYSWNDRAPEQVRGDLDIGFLADEVDAVLPELVAKDAQGTAVGIAYGKITSVNVRAIQELKAANDQLAADNEALRQRLAALEQAVQSLQPTLAGNR